MNKHQRYAKRKALNFRKDKGFTYSEPINLKSFIMKLGVLSIFKPLSDSFSGMAIKSNKDRFILINSSQTLGRQNFTLCHELYHLYIQENFDSRICFTGRFDSSDPEEYRADLFAVNFLLPEEAIIDNIPAEEYDRKKISLDTIVRLEQLFSCSRSALLNRMQNLGLIKQRTYDAYKSNVILSALERGYDKDLYLPTNKNNVIGDYGNTARKLFEQEKVSESHYRRLMNDIGINIWEEENLEDEL